MARILFLILSKPLQMDAKFSPKVKDVIAFSREEAVRLGHDYIDAQYAVSRSWKTYFYIQTKPHFCSLI